MSSHRSLSPSIYLEGYIALRQRFEAGADYVPLEPDTYGLEDEVGAIIESRDPVKKAALLALPLGDAVSTGIHMVKEAGEQDLVTSAGFSTKLQKFLRSQYNAAVEIVLPDNKNIPPFPLEEKRLIAALMHGARSRVAVDQVQRMLTSEASARD